MLHRVVVAAPFHDLLRYFALIALKLHTHVFCPHNHVYLFVTLHDFRTFSLFVTGKVAVMRPVCCTFVSKCWNI
jgi:hypothetical protein